MRSEINNILSTNPDYYILLRQYPHWHRILSRYPKKIEVFLEEYKIKRRKRFIDRLDDFIMVANLWQNLPE